jgi:succinate dehydrogenase / fumarate reductase cytochrome b subunit
MTETARKRPEFRNINAISDLPTYRLPAAGWVSILHRVSGALMFLLMPFIIWAYLHHFIAGIRHLYMDINHAVTKEFGKSSAIVTLVLSLGLTVVLGAKLFGLY